MNQAQFTNDEPEDLAEMTHPPIPPNCPLFVAGAFELFDGDGCIFMVLLDWPLPEDTVTKRQNQHELEIYRPIIAAVARCAWLDEAERLRHDKVWLSDPWDMRTGRARENAEAWREWGYRQCIKTVAK